MHFIIVKKSETGFGFDFYSYFKRQCIYSSLRGYKVLN